MRIGLIQTRGIGDIVIAAPIAQHFVDQGHEVLWPVDRRFQPFVQAAFPEIRFLAVDTGETGDATRAYFYDTPAALLQAAGCEQVFCLYSYLSGLDVVNARLAKSLKFDEYKYAVAGVPFARKWQLRVSRDAAREQALFEWLDIRGPYALLHEFGSNFRLQIELPPDITASHQVVRISELSSNPFDWLGVIERASLFACVDSCFANLAEQLDLCARKFLFLRSDIGFTPVFRNNWQFR
ncbi:hypothetical protein RD110_09095 [Rhodoferax koreense]|uniref:Glycosyltransferase family 9 protein n=1 Tax=Rhodoferax koreensis TaxID=1842727 RepID=A0A1P8JU84_9BURK|nr:hypothetical protein [Rhodoferax koreense]APW37329.1 hypothetical protein RD110_09095 [Rhodoferax koreense]